MTLDITSKLMILLAAYTLVHAAVYIWSQDRRKPGELLDDGFDESFESSNDHSIPKRRFASRIHSGRSSHQVILIAAMLLAAGILTALVLLANGY